MEAGTCGAGSCPTLGGKCKGSPGPMEAGTDRRPTLPPVERKCKGSPGPMEAGTRLQPRARADPSAVQREPGPDGSRDHSNAAIEVSVTHCAKGARARWKPGPTLLPRPTSLTVPCAKGARARWKPGLARCAPVHPPTRVQREPGPDGSRDITPAMAKGGWDVPVQREPGPDGSRDDLVQLALAQPGLVQREPGPDGNRDESLLAAGQTQATLCKGSPDPMEAGTKSALTLRPFSSTHRTALASTSYRLAAETASSDLPCG